MINHYRASRHCAVLGSYMRSTSIDAYHALLEKKVLETQEANYLSLLIGEPDGLTDAEAARSLRLPCSTVAARRNGINKKHVEAMDAGHKSAYTLIVGDGRRKNPSGMSAIVWRLNHDKEVV